MTRAGVTLLLLTALVVAVGAAIGLWRWRAPAEAPTAAPPQAKSDPTESPSVPSAVPVPGAADDARVAFTVYFPSRQYVETGNESLERLVAEPVRLEPALAAAGSDRIAAALLQALRSEPKSAAALPAFPDRVQIRSVHVRSGVAEIDLARVGLSGSSLEEQLFVRSIVRTLTRLPDVNAVRFLVEGKQAETLMGHVSILQPLATFD